MSRLRTIRPLSPLRYLKYEVMTSWRRVDGVGVGGVGVGGVGGVAFSGGSTVTVVSPRGFPLVKSMVMCNLAMHVQWLSLRDGAAQLDDQSKAPSGRP